MHHQPIRRSQNVPASMPLAGFQAGSKDAALGAGWQLLARLTCDGDSPWLDQVLLLPVTSPGRDEVPAISLDHLNYLADFERHEGRSSRLVRLPVKPARSRRLALGGTRSSIRRRGGRRAWFRSASGRVCNIGKPSDPQWRSSSRSRQPPLAKRSASSANGSTRSPRPRCCTLLLPEDQKRPVA